MSIETVLSYINVYGYFIIFIFLFFGVVGIPAPEESLLFLIGMLIGYGHLSFGWAASSASLGVLFGMLVAYVCGRYIGTPFIDKFGKYIGVTPERWGRVKNDYMKNAYRTIVFGLYLPGIRQLSPYFAGIVHVPFPRYLLGSLLGTLLWTLPMIAAGYYAGVAFHIQPKYAPVIGLFFLVLFIFYIVIKKVKERRIKN